MKKENRKENKENKKEAEKKIEREPEKEVKKEAKKEVKEIKSNRVLEIALIIITLLLATAIITGAAINAVFSSKKEERTPIMSYDSFSLNAEQLDAPTSGEYYVQGSAEENSSVSSIMSVLESSLESSSSENTISSAASSASSASSVSSSASYSSRGTASQASSRSSSKAASKSETTSAQSSSKNETTSQAEQKVSVHEHSYSERTVEPTCISKGYTLHTCDCGSSYADNYKKALGHSYGEWETLEEATTTSKGLERRICSRCSQKDYRYTEKLKVDNSPNSDFANEVVELINKEREKNGCDPLEIDSTLMNNAYTRSTELEDSFSHKRPNGEQGYELVLKLDYSIVGENIAAGQATPEDVVDAWMNSAGHCANILNPEFTNTGVGCYISSDGWIYWTQLFGG